MIRVAHDAGASIRQLAEVSGLGRKSVTAIVSPTEAADADRSIAASTRRVRVPNVLISSWLRLVQPRLSIGLAVRSPGPQRCPGE